MHLIALVRGISPRTHLVQISQGLQTQVGALFREQTNALLKDASAVRFNPGHIPETDEVHYIDPFEDKEKLIATAQNPLSMPKFDVSDSMLDRLVGLYVVTNLGGAHTACFQPFDRRHALTEGRLAILKVGQGFQKLDKRGMILDSQVSIVLRGSRLLFRSFHVASRIFTLTNYFHEATDEQVDEFRSANSIVVKNEADFARAADSSRVRKQIALVLSSGVLDKMPVQKIVSEASAVAPGVKITTSGSGKNMKIVLPEKRAELKEVLDVLLENYYKGCFTGTGYVTNSKRPA